MLTLHINLVTNTNCLMHADSVCINCAVPAYLLVLVLLAHHLHRHHHHLLVRPVRPGDRWDLRSRTAQHSTADMWCNLRISFFNFAS
jgi:hypothetical protein